MGTPQVGWEGDDGHSSGGVTGSVLRVMMEMLFNNNKMMEGDSDDDCDVGCVDEVVICVCVCLQVMFTCSPTASMLSLVAWTFPHNLLIM